MLRELFDDNMPLKAICRADSGNCLHYCEKWERFVGRLRIDEALFLTSLHHYRKTGSTMLGSFSRFSTWTFWLIMLALVGVSCSSKTKLELFPVRGKVVYKDKPAAGVLLTFIPVADSDGKAARPIATSAEDGTFIAITNDEEGAPAGEYIVTMVWMQDKSAPDFKKGDSISMRMTSDPVDKLGGKYRDRKNGTNVKIEKGPNELKPFELK